MTRNQTRQAEALRKARERQRELDRKEDEERAAARERIAAGTASAIVALQRRTEAERALAAATAQAGAVLRALLAEGVDVDRAASLLELDATEVRRLVKAARPGPGPEPERADGVTVTAPRVARKTPAGGDDGVSTESDIAVPSR